MPLAPHHAVYALSLHEAGGNSDVIGISGTMVFDLADLCASWGTAQHLAMTLAHADGHDATMVSDYATIERKDGARMEFHARQTDGGAVTQAFAGTAKLGAAGGTAVFDDPEKPALPLPAGTKFPIAHTEAVLAAASAGRRFSNIVLFDGTEREVDDTFVVSEGWGAAHATGWPALAGLASGRVRVSFFGRNAASDTPEYEIGMRYYANGVADDLELDFGDFAVDGVLKALTVRAPVRCLKGDAP